MYVYNSGSVCFTSLFSFVILVFSSMSISVGALSKMRATKTLSQIPCMRVYSYLANKEDSDL